MTRDGSITDCMKCAIVGEDVDTETTWVSGENMLVILCIASEYGDVSVGSDEIATGT